MEQTRPSGTSEKPAGRMSRFIEASPRPSHESSYSASSWGSWTTRGTRGTLGTQRTQDTQDAAGGDTKQEDDQEQQQQQQQAHGPRCPHHRRSGSVRGLPRRVKRWLRVKMQTIKTKNSGWSCFEPSSNSNKYHNLLNDDQYDNDVLPARELRIWTGRIH